MTESSDGLLELVAVIRRRWAPLLLVCVVVFGGAIRYAETRHDQYEAFAIVSVAPRPRAGGADLVRIGAPKYASYISAPSTLRPLARRLGEPPGLLLEGANAEVAPDTGNLIISVRLPTGERAAKAANALANQVVRFGADDKLLLVNHVARADVPTTPAGPSRRLIEAAGLIVGLLLGIAIAALLERLAPAMRPRQDHALISYTPIIGRLPWSKSLRLEPEQALADPSVAAAAVDLVMYLEREIAHRSMRVLVVTSPVGNDGKTTVAKLIAPLLAIGNESVLLVDAHPANPELSQRFGINGGAFHDVVEGESSIEDRVKQAWVERLWILGTSYDPSTHSPARDRLLEFVRQAEERFALLIFDAAPLDQSHLARELTTIADGVILVTSATRPAEQAQAAVAALREDSVVFVGVVTNGVREITQPGSGILRSGGN